MALPDLRRLAIGTHGAPCARTDGPQSAFDASWWKYVPFEIVEQIAKENHIDAPRQHPKDALQAYDLWCHKADNEPPVLFMMFKVHKMHKMTLCRALLEHIFEKYGWKERLYVERGLGATQKGRLRISARTLDTASEPLTTLRDLAYLHAACYVRDDEAKDVLLPGREEPVRTVVADHVRDRKCFVADVQLLKFEYVTSKLVLYASSARSEFFKSSWNGDVRRWNPRSLRDASMLFLGEIYFQGNGLNEWEMTNLENADYMFAMSKLMAQNLERLNPASLRSAEGMFTFCRNFRGNGLNSWRADWATNLSSASWMFHKCESLNISNVANWRLPNNELNALGMFHDVPISLAQAETLAKSMSINTRGTERNMVEIETERLRHFPPIYNSGDDPHPVTSAGELDPKNPWHVAGAIFGHVVDGAYRGPHVMAQLVKAVEKWQEEYPA